MDNMIQKTREKIRLKSNGKFGYFNLRFTE